MMTINDLIFRVKQATGSDPRLNAEIACAFIFTDCRPADPNDFGGKYGYQPESIFIENSGFLLADNFTGSVDDALCLLDRLKPGCFYLLGRGKTRHDEPPYGAQLMFGSDEILGFGEAPTMPLAIILALLEAVKADGQTP